jgi:hypothetical protein
LVTFAVPNPSLPTNPVLTQKPTSALEKEDSRRDEHIMAIIVTGATGNVRRHDNHGFQALAGVTPVFRFDPVVSS